MYVDGIWLKDHDGRTRILRGANLGGSSKVPYTPDGATYCNDNFYDHRTVSFVGRPFPLNEADEHLRRLQAWGLTFLRFLVTWEAIEHAGPGQYDEEYLDYVYKVVRRANDYGIEVFIDPHQDVWSRWTGGDGAPGWTLEAVGIDLTKLHETGAAITHQTHGDPFPRMIWPTNYTRFGAATMFTLFFGGNDFAPETRIDNVPVQEYLQSHYIDSIKQVVLRLKDLPNVVGYDSLNEPLASWIGQKDVNTLPEHALARLGTTLTPYQAMMAAAGFSVEAEVVEMGFGGAQSSGRTTVNPEGVRLWREGYPDIWQQNGVWAADGGNPEITHSDHFGLVNGRTPDFMRDYLKPFIVRYAKAIRTIDPHAIIFVEGAPGGGHLDWGADDPAQVVNAGHWYDGVTLFTKQFNPDFTFDLSNGQMVNGRENVAQVFADQIGAVKRNSQERMGGVPTLIGEFGLPFDLDDKAAYTSGDFSPHVCALDMYFDAMDTHLLNCTIWNYTADNTNLHGDLWNDEDLSIFSRDQRSNSEDIHSGGRALEAIVRPYARRIAGEPLRMMFDLETQVFELEFRHDPAVTAPTEIFVPEYQYPNGIAVELSDGAYEYLPNEQMVVVRHSADRATHTIRITRLSA